MTKNKWITICAIVIITLIFIAGCTKTEPTGYTTKEDIIKIGAVLSLTGPGASFGENLRQGLEWKIEELNNQGYNIKLYIEDSQSDPKQAVLGFNKLAEVNDVKIIYSILSSVGMTLKPLANEKQVLLWADSAHPELTKDTNYVLRHSNLADEDAIKMAEHLIDKGFEKVGIIYQQDDWGLVHNEVLSKKLREKGIIVFSEKIDPKDSDFKTTLLKMKLKEPETLVFVAFGPAAGTLIKQAKEIGYEGTIHSSIGLIITSDAISIAKEYLPGTYYQTFKENPGFKKDYQERFSKEPGLAGFIGYTDIELLIHTIEQIKSTEPEKIIDYIKNLGEFEGKYETVKINPNGDIILQTEIRKWE